MSENNLTHFDAAGNAVMVDVSGKPVTAREATARGILTMNAEAFAAVQSGTVKKGDVLGVARIAGIMAAKRTSELIPLCHPLPLTKVCVDFELLPEQQAVEARCTVKTSGVTGVEMEALTGVHMDAHGITDEKEYAALLSKMAQGSISTDVLFKASLTRAQEQSLLDCGALIDLAPLIEENMPNLSALLAAHPDWKQAIALEAI